MRGAFCLQTTQTSNSHDAQFSAVPQMDSYFEVFLRLNSESSFLLSTTSAQNLLKAKFVQVTANCEQLYVIVFTFAYRVIESRPHSITSTNPYGSTLQKVTLFLATKAARLTICTS